MSWQNEMTLIVRHLINDVDGTTYNDSRIEETILVAAQLIKYNVDFDNNYTIDADSCVISPDPTSGTKDDAFISIVCLKAACIILNGEAKTYAAQGIVVKDGPSTIDTTKRFNNISERAKEMCEAVLEAIKNYKTNGSRGARAVISAYVREVGYYNELDMRG